MAVLIIATPATAVAGINAASFVSDNYTVVTFAIGGGVTTDTVTVKVSLPDGQTSAATLDVNAQKAGVLNATNPVLTFVGGPTYVFTKTGTTDTIGLYALVSSAP